jgi:hypothetical protein
MVSFRDIRRSTFRRFLPGWSSTLIGLPLIFKPGSLLDIGPRQFALIALYSSIALAGHALTLLLLRSRLRADVSLTDSKSFIIGVCSVLTVLAGSIVRRSRLDYVEIAAIYAAVASVLTALVYAPWIRNRSKPDDSGRVDLLWVRVRAYQEMQ